MRFILAVGTILTMLVFTSLHAVADEKSDSPSNSSALTSTATKSGIGKSSKSGGASQGTGGAKSGGKSAGKGGKSADKGGKHEGTKGDKVGSGGGAKRGDNGNK